MPQVTARAAGDEGVRLRVMSYNVHGQRDDVRALAAAVRAVRPDALVVQEGPRRFRWRHGCAALAERLGLVVAAGGLPGLGNLLLVDLRVRVRRTWCLRFPLTPGRHLRGAALAECAVGGARFVLAGSHLSIDAAERLAQARLLDDALRAVAEPTILGIDVNEQADGPAWAELAAGRTDAADAAGRAGQATFPAASPRARIDAILTDPRIEVTGCQVVDDARTRRASDHLPVVADLVLPVAG